MKTIRMLFLSLIAPLLSSGQMEGNHWFFGHGGGVDFDLPNNGPDVPDQSSPIFTDEGCATASDGSGNLLFYTDGRTVWDDTHTPVIAGLNGHTSSTQSAVIIPRPCHDSIYYIATTDFWQGTNGLWIYEININTWNIVSSQQLLAQAPTCERMDVTMRTNANSYWLATTEYTNTTQGTIAVWEITANGVSAIQTTQTGPPIWNVNPWPIKTGAMKFSLNGRFMAAIRRDSLDIYQFNSNTGQIAHWLTVGNSCHYGGLEFSPNSQYLYATRFRNPTSCATTDGAILRYDLQATNVQGSQIILATNANRYTALQLTPENPANKSIYVCRLGLNAVAQIQNPNAAVPTIVNNAMTLSPGDLGWAGLPQYMTRTPKCFRVNGPQTMPGTTTNLPLNFRGGIQFVDMNGDFLNDVVYLENANNMGPAEIKCVFNTGTQAVPVFTNAPVVLYTIPTIPTLMHPICFYVFDIAGDGTQEIYFLGRDPGNPTGLRVQIALGPNYTSIMNTAIAVPPTTDIRSLLAGYVSTNPTDLFPDIFVGAQNGTNDEIRFHLNTNGQFPPTGVVVATIPLGFPWFNSFANARLLDADCDGDNDLFVGLSTVIQYYENTNPNVLGTPSFSLGASSQFGINSILGNTDWLIPNFCNLNGGCLDLVAARQGVGTQYQFYDGVCSCQGAVTPIALPGSSRKAIVGNDIASPLNPAFPVYPNPARDAFYIQGSVNEIEEIAVLDMVGRRVPFNSFHQGDRIQIRLDDQERRQVLFVRIKTKGGGITTLKLLME